MKNIAFTIIFALLAIPQAHGSSVKSCVLYFERIEHPFWPEIKKIFAKNRSVVLVSEAKPIDVLKCIQENNPEEILLFAHAFDVDQSMTRLGFFQSVGAEQAEINRKQAVTEMQKALTGIYNDPQFHLCANYGDNSTRCQNILQLEASLRQTAHKATRMSPKDQIYKLVFGYSKGLFFQKPFNDLETFVQKQKDVGLSLRLKKIRLMSCEPKKIFKAYPALERIINEQGIKLDIAPTNWFQSWINDKQVTTINESWLRSSLGPR